MTGFLSTLNPEQREAALTPFEGDENVGTAVSEIPEGIAEDVWQVARGVWVQIVEDEGDDRETIARAIMDERERCAKVVEAKTKPLGATPAAEADGWNGVRLGIWKALDAAIEQRGKQAAAAIRHPQHGDVK